jgi:hypothetical protein
VDVIRILQLLQQLKMRQGFILIGDELSIFQVHPGCPSNNLVQTNLVQTNQTFDWFEA